jgi:hypothetical protein
LVIAGGHLTFSATLPFAEPIVVQLTLPPLPQPRSESPSAAASHVNQSWSQDVAPKTLVTLVPDAQGHVSGSVTIPPQTIPGDHVLTLTTANGQQVLAATPLRVLQSASADTLSAQVGAGNVAWRPSERASAAGQFTKPLLAAGAMTIGTGLGGWALRRRRSQPED